MQVRHPNIVQFYGAGITYEGVPFLVTELMELGSLRDVLAAQTLDWPTRFRFARETALGIGLVHSLNRLHRDLKSANILVSAVSGVMRLKVGRTVCLL